MKILPAVLFLIVASSCVCEFAGLKGLKDVAVMGNLPDAQAIANAQKLEDLAPLVPQLLTQAQSDLWQKGLGITGWTTSTGKSGLQIRKSYVFADFRHAFWFMRLSASAADRVDHHPEWFNVYNKVDVLLTTHDVGGLSCKDIIIAYYMEQFAVSASTQSQADLQTVFRINATEEQLFSINFSSFQTQTKKIDG